MNPKEGLIGLYTTGHNIESAHLILLKYYEELVKEKKNKALMKTPLMMLIDPTMQDNKLSIKVSKHAHLTRPGAKVGTFKRKD